MTNRIKEQLLGFINTPPLWKDGDLFELFQFQLPEIPLTNTTLDIPELRSNYVLGKRMETFFEYVLTHSEKYEVIGKNLQVFNRKITLGELDFLIKDLVVGAVYHIELVYKFYIYDPSFEDNAARWIGPNRKDSLLQKISRLKHHQLPLLQKEETREILKSFQIPVNTIEQKVCFKASLFIPKGLNDKNFSGINKDCIAGYWIRFGDFSNTEYGTNLFYAPNKQDWPVDPFTNENWVSYNEICEQIQELFVKKKSPLIWMQLSNGSTERFFVVWW